MMKRQFRWGVLAGGVLALGMLSSAAYAQQASITLTNCSGDDCHVHDNTWTLDKTVTGNTVDPSTGQGTVTWTVTATKDSSGPATYSVHGGLTVTNTGSAPATIGNIVVNLQKPNNPKKGSNASYVSIAANVADATNGDAATAAQLVAAGSQENAAANAAWGTNNYTVSGAKGTFSETSCSGSLEFTDASNNTAFSLVPQPSIPVGGSVTLLYHADFDISCLPSVGTTLRVEAIVTFGNAGARGGSGATGSNIDISGNGQLDADEAKVRSVPCRVTLGALLPPQEANDSVIVTDTGATTTGTVTISNPVGFDGVFPATVSLSTSWDVSVDVDGGIDGGTVCNAASLSGTAVGGTLGTIVGYQTVYDDATMTYQQVPVYATYECAPAAEGQASSCIDVNSSDDIPDNGDFCSFSQGGFGGSGYPFDLLSANFATLYPSGVEAGIAGVGGFSMRFTNAAAVQSYLPAGGGANPLNADLTNPTSTSSGQFGGQLLALKLNVALSDAAVTPGGFGDLYYCDATSSLNGQTVRQILSAAETALGGGAVPSGYTYASLAGLAANLDLSFDGKSTEFPNCGVASAWAVANLSKTACQ